MIINLEDTLKHPLFSGSMVMIIGTNLGNFLGYMYHLIFGRLLEPVGYGELAAIISLVGLITAVFSFLGTTTVKFVSIAREEELVSVHEWIKSKIIRVGIVVFVLLLLTAPLLSNFLKIDLSTALLISPIVLFNILAFMNNSFLQGLLKFKESVLVNNLGWIGKILSGILLFYIGLSLFGVVAGMLFASIATFLLGSYFVGVDQKNKVKKKSEIGKSFIKYAIPVFVMSVSTTSLISMDVILAKHFLEPFDAGVYASLSTMGKIVYFGAAPVATVMFPLVSQKSSRTESSFNIFLLGIILTSLISLGVLFFFWLFPQLSISVLFGNQYESAATYLVWFGLFAAFISVSFYLVNFYLSKSYTKVSYITAVAALLQFLGIYLFHNSLQEVIMISLVVSIGLYISLGLYGTYIYRRVISGYLFSLSKN